LEALTLRNTKMK